MNSIPDAQIRARLDLQVTRGGASMLTPNEDDQQKNMFTMLISYWKEGAVPLESKTPLGFRMAKLATQWGSIMFRKASP